MMKPAQPLDPQLARRLLSYAAIATAGVAAASTQANAEVVYTPTHQTLQQRYSLDLNNDGIADFHLSSSYISGFGKVAVTPLTFGNRIAATPQKCASRAFPAAAAALRSGAIIGKGLPFLSNANCMANLDSFSSYGAWQPGDTRYLGLVFVVDGTTHFGWARLRRNSFFCPGCIAALLGYAYETTPGKPIVAGDEGAAAGVNIDHATLGALALGASALPVWRKQEGN